MADNSKKVSELPTAANVASSDRVLVLRDPAGTPSVRTVNVGIFIANVSTIVTANILSSNIVSQVANTITPSVVANVVPTVIANVTPTITNDVIQFFTNNISNNIFLSIRNETPANNSANGVSGIMTYDTNYLYVCIANNTWKRTAISTW